MKNFEFTTHPHRRYNPLNGKWVLVSPHRTQRPWQGKREKTDSPESIGYDPECYLCPGNKRASGRKNPDYSDVFVFKNDFSALMPETPAGCSQDSELFRAQSEKGVCKVVCFSPRHDVTIPLMDIEHIRRVVDAWCSEYRELGSLDFITHVQIFENKGETMGCSNPHPHGQIWAQQSIPDEPAREMMMQQRYLDEYGRTLMTDYLEKELRYGERIVAENDDFAALVPFWAVWPFETMIISRHPVQNLLQLNDAERVSLAKIYKAVTVMYDNLFEVSFPYSSGIHQSPTDGRDHPEWHLHMHFYPPLLRAADIKKFMVGYEMLAEPQRDLTAEQSARILGKLPEVHYKHRSGFKDKN